MIVIETLVQSIIKVGGLGFKLRHCRPVEHVGHAS
jgi:hypothetical protein